MIIREIAAEEITQTVKRLCIEANTILGRDVIEGFEKGYREEASPAGRSVIQQLQENAKIAEKEGIPLCQDTGLVVVFVELGQEVHVTDGGLNEAKIME